MRILAPLLLLILVFSSRSQAAFQMPDLTSAKSVSICELSDESKLTRICDLVEPSTVKRICAGIAASEARPGTKLLLEPGPVLVFVDGTGKPLIAFMQKLDGWLAAFAVDRKDREWILGKALMESAEYRRPTPDYPCWDLVYQVWLHTVNPELYKAEQDGRGQPATRPESK